MIIVHIVSRQPDVLLFDSDEMFELVFDVGSIGGGVFSCVNNAFYSRPS